MHNFETYLEEVKQKATLRLRPDYFQSDTNQMAPEDFDKLLETIHTHDGLKQIDFRLVNFPPEQVGQLVGALEKHDGLQSLEISDGWLDQPSIDMLVSYAGRNRNLQAVKLRGSSDDDLTSRQLEEALLRPGNRNLLQVRPATDAMQDFMRQNEKWAKEHARLIDRIDISRISPHAIWNIEHHSEVIANFTEVNLPEALYAQLPKLDADTAPSCETLFQPGREGFTPLDNPMTWRKHPDLLAELAQQGELDETSLMQTTPKGHTLLEYALGLGDARTAICALNRHGMRLGANWLLQENSALSPIGTSLIERDALDAAFTAENWRGAPRTELNAALKALPDNLRNQIPNRHQLQAQTASAAGRHINLH